MVVQKMKHASIDATIVQDALAKLITVHEETGEVLSLVERLVGSKINGDVAAVVDSYVVDYLQAHCSSLFAKGDFFSAATIAKKYSLSVDDVAMDLSNEQMQKSYSASFFKLFFTEFFSSGRVLEDEVQTYFTFLDTHSLSAQLQDFDPVAVAKEYGVTFGLGTTLSDVVVQKRFGATGKCIAFYDSTAKSFLLEGNVHPDICLHADMTPLRFPNLAYEHGGGFGYHKQLIPANHKVKLFGGARYVLHNDGLCFFHESGDFGEMSPYLTSEIVFHVGASLHPQAFDHLAGGEYFDVSRPDVNKAYFATTLLNESSSALRTLLYQRSSKEDGSLVSRSQDDSPDDDLPF
jgi:hypothetical protein